MRLLLFTGFLGSGKTTLAIKLARLAVEQGNKVAILVNEIVKAGIDNQGCICCTPSADMVSTLQQKETDAKIARLSGFLTLAYDPIKDTRPALGCWAEC